MIGGGERGEGSLGGGGVIEGIGGEIGIIGNYWGGKRVEVE